MRPALSAALALCLCDVAQPASAAARSGSGVERHQTSVGDWHLDVVRDRFSGLVTCRLRARADKATYEGQAVGFAFGRRRDVGEAVYRIDGGPPRTARDDFPELLRLGTPTDTGGMANPTGGIVWIPYAALVRANSVAIEPSPGRRPRTFHLLGLKGLLSIAHARGCRPYDGFM